MYDEVEPLGVAVGVDVVGNDEVVLVVVLLVHFPEVARGYVGGEGDCGGGGVEFVAGEFECLLLEAVDVEGVLVVVVGVEDALEGVVEVAAVEGLLAVVGLEEREAVLKVGESAALPSAAPW